MPTKDKVIVDGIEFGSTKAERMEWIKGEDDDDAILKEKFVAPDCR